MPLPRFFGDADVDAGGERLEPAANIGDAGGARGLDAGGEAGAHRGLGHADVLEHDVVAGGGAHAGGVPGLDDAQPLSLSAGRQ